MEAGDQHFPGSTFWVHPTFDNCESLEKSATKKSTKTETKKDDDDDAESKKFHQSLINVSLCLL